MEESTEMHHEDPFKALISKLESAKDPLIFRDPDRPWIQTRDQIIEDVLEATSAGAEHKAESLALTKLFKSEDEFRIEDLQNAAVAEAGAESIKEDRPSNAGSVFTWRTWLSSKVSTSDRLCRPVDRVLFLVLRSTYRRSARADTAKLISTICARSDSKSEQLRRRLSQSVWERAAELPDQELSVFVGTAARIRSSDTNQSVGEGQVSRLSSVNCQAEFLLLVSAVSRISATLSDKFDVLVREEAGRVLEDDQLSIQANRMKLAVHESDPVMQKQQEGPA